MKYSIFPFLLVVVHVTAIAQCDEYIVSGSEVFHANNIRTRINTGGDMFWNLYDGVFLAPYTGSQTPSAMFASAVWMGGYDENGNLKLAAQTYRSATRLETQEYLPGPLTEDGVPFSSNCADWDKVWSVQGYEIAAHLRDFQDNGIIDDPQPAVFAWPGVGNVFFEAYNGFILPSFSQGGFENGYAPFHDVNQNGIYEPDMGEYPLPAGLSNATIPAQTTWHVFNDARLHRNSLGDPLHFEVQQTCYAFYCSESDALNNTLFMDFKVVNRGATLDSVYFGLWTDADLGCFTDDYFGSVPEMDAFMVYNEDSIDGTNGHNCDQGVLSYQEGPPVLSGTFLNTGLSSLMYYVNSSVGDFPAGMTDPHQGAPVEFYRFLSGHWVDGTSLCFGGTGYDPGPDCVPVKHAFSGDPSDPFSWSMENIDFPYGDRRFIPANYLGTLVPGESKTISIAYALHLDPQKDNLENVSLMYEELPVIRQYYSNGFIECIQDESCSEDCVWPGDANHDGIANNLDLVALGLAYAKTGMIRNAPLTWAPHSASPWADIFTNGVNVKHTDVNGNGMIDYVNDLDILNENYGNTHDNYQPHFQCMEGNGIVVKGGFALSNPVVFQTRTEVVLDADIVSNLNGLAFTVRYDTAYFQSATVVLEKSPFAQGSNAMITHAAPGVIDYATVRTDGVDELLTEDKSLMVFLFSIKNKDLLPGQNDTTQVCIGNILAVLNDGTEIPLGSNSIEFVFLEPTSAVPAELTEGMISIFPNPSAGQVTVEVADHLIGASFSVVDAVGRERQNGNIESARIDLELPSGMSFLIVSSAAGRLIRKIVVLD